MKFNGFIAGLFAAIILAYLFPRGIELLPLKTITDIGIGFIFFFYGLKLSPGELKSGFFNFKAHLIIQTTTFIIFPLLAFAFLPLFKEGLTSNLWISLFFLAALPSTVSSSIVMVSIARGNLPTAIFNASLSGIIGIIATPLWISFIMESITEFSFRDVVTKLFLQIILPLIIGLFLQKFFGSWARTNRKHLSNFDKLIILLIVYNSFSNSFLSNIFSEVVITDLIVLAGCVIIIFFIIYYGLDFICQLLRMKTEDIIAVKFCGTKKSLVHGSVMAAIIFGETGNLGLILLPVMIYHTLQLVLIAYYAEKHRKRPMAGTSIL